MHDHAVEMRAWRDYNGIGDTRHVHGKGHTKLWMTECCVSIDARPNQLMENLRSGDQRVARDNQVISQCLVPLFGGPAPSPRK
jgi:hypothetical protein